MGKKEVKINAQVYRKKVLRPVLIPWSRKTCGLMRWTFQQDSARSHRASATQGWLKANFSVSTDPELWPPCSPNLNPIDYGIWGILQAKACARKHTSLESFKKSLQLGWSRTSDEVIRDQRLSIIQNKFGTTLMPIHPSFRCLIEKSHQSNDILLIKIG